MPKSWMKRPGTNENVSGTAYQENDYLIAAETGYFNQQKNAGTVQLYTEGGNLILSESIKELSDLDPTLIKAMSIQESHAGTTGTVDIMQVNAKGDWDDTKTKYGLEKEKSVSSKSESVIKGIRRLGTKGFKGGVTYDKKTGKSTYTFQGWGSATNSYNGGGVPNYQEHVEQMVNESKTFTTSDY